MYHAGSFIGCALTGDNGLGDGDLPNDIQNASYGTPDLTFQLRSERSGKGQGRIYTVTYVAMDAIGNTSVGSAFVTVPHDRGKGLQTNVNNLHFDEFALLQNSPNPFNPMTTISYQLPIDSWVRLTIYNMLGKEVATLVDGMKDAGFKSVEFSATNLASGVYYYRLQAGDFVQTKKLLLLR